MKFCRNCGAQLDDAAQFCATCGTPAAPAQPQAPRQPAGNVANLIVPPANLKEHLNYKLNLLGGNKWKYVALIGMLFLEFIIASFMDCLKITISMFGYSQSATMSLWHEEFDFLSVIVCLALFVGVLAAAAPLLTKLPHQKWNLYAIVGANALLLLVTLWMFLDVVSLLDDMGSPGFTFFGIVLLILNVASLVLSGMMLKAPKAPTAPQ